MKKKLSNFWYYNKWYVLFALLVLWAVGNFFLERSQIVEPDAIVSFVTMAEVSEETQETLRQKVTELAGDANGDGRTEIEINVYAYDGEGSNGTDPERYAADAVHLASEVKLQTTSFFVTNLPELFAEMGTVEQMGVWKDYEMLRQIEDTQLSEFQIYVFAQKEVQLLNKLK